MPARRATAALIAVIASLVLSGPAVAAAPPPPPFGLSATQTAGTNEVVIRFADVPEAVRFQVHRGSGPLFVPSDENRVLVSRGGLGNDRDYVGAPGSYAYKVVAENLAGERSAPSASTSITVQFDPAGLPSASIAAPAEAGTVSGTVPIALTGGDPDGIARVELNVDTPTAATVATGSLPGTIHWDSTSVTNGAHLLIVRVTDGKGLTRTVTRRVVVDNPRALSLLAAYGLDSGSGSVATDSSGHEKSGTIQGATWTAGRHGGALQFDGRDDSVVLPKPDLSSRRPFTLEAWVKKAGSKRDVAVAGSWDGGDYGGPMLWVDHVSGRYIQTLGIGAASYLDSGRSPAVGTWQHVATTYDGERARVYLDGTEVAQRVYLGDTGGHNHWRIGAYGATAGHFFDGAIDEVRLYRRALTASEVRADMEEPVAGAPPTSPPSAPRAAGHRRPHQG